MRMTLPTNIFVKIKHGMIVESTVDDIDGRPVHVIPESTMTVNAKEGSIYLLKDLIPLLEGKGYDVKYVHNNSWPVYHFKRAAKWFW